MSLFRIEYFVTPVVCAAAGAALGWISRNRNMAWRNAAWCLLVVVAMGVVELLWHEAPRIDPLQRPRVVLAMAIALWIPAAVGFLLSFKVARSAWQRGLRIWTAVIALLLALSLYPLYALYFLCYVGHDCI